MLTLGLITKTKPLINLPFLFLRDHSFPHPHLNPYFLPSENPIEPVESLPSSGTGVLLKKNLEENLS